MPASIPTVKAVAAGCAMEAVTIALHQPDPDGLDGVVETLRSWQDDSLSLQLHPGDLGWAWQHGAEAVAASVRTWHAGDRTVAIGMVDSPTVLRLIVAPDLRDDAGTARQLVSDVADPQRGVLPAGGVSVEAPNGTAVQAELTASGWTLGEPWTPLQRDLTDPVSVPDVGLRVGDVTPERLAEFVATHRSSFGSTRFTPELWTTMAAGTPYRAARSLIGIDAEDNGVAIVTVWSAGPGRPGLLEPLGVHADHHGHGYGRAVTLAAAAALRELGASSAQVCTPSARVPAVATYRSAGFVAGQQRLDRTRAAAPPA